MAKVLGINALVYVGGVQLSSANSWSITVNRELKEARVFQGTAANASWVEQTGAFKSWSGSVNGYYDNASETQTDLVLGAGRALLVLYEDRNTLANYWYGYAWFEMSQDTPVDDFVELNVDFTGDGQLTRI